MSRQCYLGEKIPGTNSAVPTSGLSENVDNFKYSIEESENGYENFCVIETFIKSIQYVTDAHSTHNYQILAKKFKSHSTVVLLLMTYNIFWCLPLAYLLFDGNNDIFTSLIFLLLSYIPYIIWCYKNDAGIPKEL